MEKIKITGLMFLLIMVIAACNKDEGEGGKSTITGRILLKQYDKNFSVLHDSFYVGDQDVFIIYGDSEIHNDDIATNYDGTYSFKYLRPGNYTLCVYSDDTVPGSQKEIPVIKEITIDKKEQRIEAEDIIIYEVLDYNDGNSSISGTVHEINYLYNYTQIKDTAFAQDEDVFIVYDDDDYHFDDIETSHNGKFRFDNLIKGEYTIFVYSEDTTGASQDIPISINVKITDHLQHIDVGDIYIRD